ncbi:MAG: UbiA family prenyltransferase, partial [Gemmatimonadota bacterium]
MSLRPRLWARNVVVFVPLLFGGLLWQGAMLLRALAALLVLCALGGAASIMDDLADMDSDRRHPLKADRPIPSGRLRMSHALLAILMLLVGGLLAAQYLG